MRSVPAACARAPASHGGNAAFCSRRPRKFNSAAPSCAIEANQVFRLYKPKKIAIHGTAFGAIAILAKELQCACTALGIERSTHIQSGNSPFRCGRPKKLTPPNKSRRRAKSKKKNTQKAQQQKHPQKAQKHPQKTKKTPPKKSRLHAKKNCPLQKKLICQYAQTTSNAGNSRSAYIIAFTFGHEPKSAKSWAWGLCRSYVHVRSLLRGRFFGVGP